MIRINIQEAKANLSHYLRRVEHGDIVVLCRHNHPIAEIRPIPNTQPTSRTFGIDQGQIVVPPEFFDPLDEETLQYFGGVRG
jgi:prevent-host-death family protein